MRRQQQLQEGTSGKCRNYIRENIGSNILNVDKICKIITYYNIGSSRSVNIIICNIAFNITL